MERKLISEADSRPLVVLDPRAPASQRRARRERARGRLARRPLRAQDRLRAAAAGRPPRGHDRPRPARVAAGARAARADRRARRPGARGRAEPPRARRLRRRARRRPAAARPGPHARRLPDRGARRDRRPPRRARGRGLPGLRRRPDGQRRRDGRGRGAPREHARRSRRPARRCARLPRAVALLPLWLARGGRPDRASSAFAGLHWVGLLEPAEPGRAWEAVGIAVLVVAALLGAARLPGAAALARGGARRARGASRSRCSRAASPTSTCGPDHWGALLSGVGRGIDALPGVRVPVPRRRRVDAAGDRRRRDAARRRSPRCSRSGRGAAAPASRPRALLALVTLYAVPAVVLDFEGEFLRGALLALLCSPSCGSRSCACATRPPPGSSRSPPRSLARCSPRRRSTAAEPWLDYESWARRDRRARRPSTFSWDHDYGPLDWPRDGRELLRVKARPARVLEGARPRPLRRRAAGARTRASAASARAAQLPASPTSVARWTPATSRSTLRNLRSDTFVTAGITTSVDGEDRLPDRRRRLQRAATGSAAATPTRAEVYTPQPDRAPAARGHRHALRGLARAPTSRSPRRRRGRRRPPADRRAQRAVRVAWPLWGEPGAPRGRALRQLRRCRPSTCWRRSELRASGRSPSGCKRGRGDAVRVRRARRGATSTTASPTPRRRRGPSRHARRLPVRRARSASASSSPAPRRCCCGWAGSPRASRPASRRARSTRRSSEYVVRDLDAHSWVEVWFPDVRLGHARPDARRRAAALAAGRRRAAAAPGGSPGAPNLGGERLSDPTSGSALAPARRAADWLVLGDRRRRSRSPRWSRRRCSSAAGAGGCRRPRCGRWPSSSARCAAPASTARPGMTLRADRARRSPAGPARRATCARCASSATRAPGGADRRAAPRPARRARPRRGRAARVVGAAAAADLRRRPARNTPAARHEPAQRPSCRPRRRAPLRLDPRCPAPQRSQQQLARSPPAVIAIAT